MPGVSAASRTTAPAPSPNSTQVSRSVQSMMRDIVSAPITSARRAWPNRTNWSATTRPYRKPEQAASTLNAGHALIPSFSCTRHATFGKMRSGVVVPTSTRSMSLGGTPAFSSAARPALDARSLVYSLSAAMCRSSMPVRDLIHSSLVSTIFSRSAFVRTRSGRYLPVPAMREYILMRPILDELADLEWNALARFDDRRLDGVLERELIRGSVALQHDAVEADEAGSVVTARIDALAQPLERRLRHEPLDVAEEAAPELLLQE